jgi:hypothetical protein
MLFIKKIIERFFFLIVCLFFASACEKKWTTLKLAVEAKTHQGDPISSASVHIEGKHIGDTDTKGFLVTELSFEQGSQPKIEVRKDSEAYYFSPFIDSILIDREDLQTSSLRAVLYFVPKPKPPSEPIAMTSLPKSEEQKNISDSPNSELGAQTQGAQEKSPVEIQDDSLGENSKSEGSQIIAAEPNHFTDSAQSPPEQLPHVTKTSVERGPPNLPTEAASTRLDELAARVAEVASSSTEPITAAARLKGEKNEKLAPKTLDDVPIDTEMTERDQSSSDSALHASSPVAQPHQDEADVSEKDLAHEKSSPSPLGPPILTLNVMADGIKDDAGIAGAEVLYADAKAKALKAACKTNVKGRCVIRFALPPEGPISFVVAKKGFKTASGQILVRGQVSQQVRLVRGMTLDIFALTKIYNHAEGLAQVEVLVDNKRVGFTDHFGHFTYLFSGKKESMLAVTLKAPGHMPEVYETDFVASGPMSVVKYFADHAPPPSQVAILTPMPAGSVDQAILNQISGPIHDAIKIGARKHIFSTAAFKEAPLAVIERAMRASNLDAANLARKGWSTLPIKATLDALMVPTIVTGAKNSIEISMVDSYGHVIAAAREELDSSMDQASIDRAMQIVSEKIIRSYPFEGAVIGKESDRVTVNIGHAQGRGIRSGDLIDVFGVQAERLGDKEKHKKIATLTVREVFDGQSKCSVGWIAPRAMIDRGDLVVLRPRRPAEASSTKIRVSTREGKRSIEVGQANVYLNGHWLGTTDETGRLYVEAHGSGSLRVVKHGFREQTLDVKFSPKGSVDLELTRESSHLRVDSRPSGATVFVEGRAMGRTPLTTPIPVPSGFVKLRIESGSGFKPYVAVLELEEGTLDLTGNRLILLETDFMSQAQRLIRSGKNSEALKVLSQVPSSHSDYLLARYEAGEILLTVLDIPEKALAFFDDVISNEAVKSFSDKRFIGAHINAAVARFRVAESLVSKDPAAARPYYQKVIEGIDAVTPHLRFVASDQYNQAVHTVDYHRALARHRLWSTSQDPQMLVDTVRTWRSYLEGDARAIPAEGSSKALVDNAEVYLKQAMASLEQSRRTMRQ